MTDNFDQIASDLRSLNDSAKAVREALGSIDAARDGLAASCAAQLASAGHLDEGAAALAKAAAALDSAASTLARFDPERIEREVVALRERVAAESERVRDDIGETRSEQRELSASAASNRAELHAGLMAVLSSSKRNTVMLLALVVFLQLAVLVTILAN